jgi:hypothetical protein
MSAWVSGFISGIAEGSNVDILGDLHFKDIIARVYQMCEANPSMMLSVAAERMAAEMLIPYGVTVK